jgi:hypothetical protein
LDHRSQLPESSPPHLAGFARETEQISDTSAQAVDLMNGRKPRFVVNPEVFETRALRAKLVG